MMARYIPFALLLAYLHSSQAGNFLILPQPVTSHCLEMIGIADELIKRNHSVTAYVPEVLKSSNCFDNSKTKIVTFKQGQTLVQNRKAVLDGVTEASFRGDVASNNITFMSMLLQVGIDICESAMMDTQKLKLLKSSNIDIVLIDSSPSSECMFYISKYLSAESVLVGSVIFPGYDLGPPQTHTFPLILSSFTSSMTLSQRLLNTLMTLGINRLIRFLMNNYFIVDKNKLKGSVPPEVLNADIHNMSRHSLLFIENSMDILDYPKAAYPNFIRAGGLTTRPAQPLPKDLDDFFAKAKKGVIVVSFGSMLRKAPPELFNRIVKIFNNFEQSVVMSYHINGQHGNVKTVSWLPQNDVLAHKNTVLFVSHCGKNGFNEGFYHAVPILCTPFHADQIKNGIKSKTLKIGSSIDLINSKDEEIIEVIKEVLSDKHIHDNIKRLSAIYHDDKFTPQEKAANALEHVLKFGGDHLRPASSEFNFISENMIDIWFIIFLCIFVYIYISYRIGKCCCKCVCRKQKLNTKKIKDVKIRNGTLN